MNARAASEPDDVGAGTSPPRRSKFWLAVLPIGTLYFAGMAAVGFAVGDAVTRSKSRASSANKFVKKPEKKPEEDKPDYCTKDPEHDTMLGGYLSYCSSRVHNGRLLTLNRSATYRVTQSRTKSS